MSKHAMPALEPRDDEPVAAARADGLVSAFPRVVTAAFAFAAPRRFDEILRSWLGSVRPGSNEMSHDQVTEAMALASELALFTPSFSGQTAFDRLARQAPHVDRDDRAALAILRQAAFRAIRVHSVRADAVVCARDLVTNETLLIRHDRIHAGLAGLAFAGRLGSIGGGLLVFCSVVTPLDEAAVAVIRGFVRPQGRAGLPLRCVEALYAHIVRYGTIRVRGLNDPAEDAAGDDTEVDDLDEIAAMWAMPGASRDPDDERCIRERSDVSDIVHVVAQVATAAAERLAELRAGFAAVLAIQLDALRRRERAGSGSFNLDDVGATIDRLVAAGTLPRAAATVFAAARAQLGATPAGQGRKDTEQDRLIARIQALRAKTVEHGCTEHEAMAAAEKVAELLDRHGLSLSALEMGRQVCEGAAIETSRKRMGPIDRCVPTVAAFFDCRTWVEKSASGTLRYVFFGMRADVEAARYLYDLVERTFETETARFRNGPVYAAEPTGMRRGATDSFAMGLGQGLRSKLESLRAERDSRMAASSGRDLVIVKAGRVEEELDRLGITFKSQKRRQRRAAISDIYRQGHETGLRFQYTPGLTHA